VPAVTEETLELASQPVLVRRAGDDPVPVLYLHDAPGSSEDLVALLERTGGIAFDLAGFGRSGKRGDLDFTPTGLARFVGDVVETLGVPRVRLCGHGWGGAVGLLWAMEDPARVERLCLIDAVPLLPGLEWHRWARAWRSRLLGEVAVGLMTRPVLRALVRGASAPASPAPRLLAPSLHATFDQGSQRALLRLYRAADPDELAALGRRLGTLSAPALVLWGARDSWLAPDFAEAYAGALPDATWEVRPDAGHWPWLDDPGALERIVSFLT
jgi:pimeloyl-ACP methyl ester carboxylesterase